MKATLGQRKSEYKNSPKEKPPGTLKSRNIRIHDRRTTIRIEPEVWDALNEVAVRQKRLVHEVCSAVYDTKSPGVSFSAALRVFLVKYYRSAAQDNNKK